MGTGQGAGRGAASISRGRAAASQRVLGGDNLEVLRAGTRRMPCPTGSPGCRDPTGTEEAFSHTQSCWDWEAGSSRLDLPLVPQASLGWWQDPGVRVLACLGGSTGAISL